MRTAGGLHRMRVAVVATAVIRDEVPMNDDLPTYDSPSDRLEAVSPEPSEPRRRPPASYWPWVVAVVVALALVVGLVYWWRSRSAAPPPVPQPVASESGAPEEAPVEPQSADIELPELEASDELVRRLVAELSQHPKLAAWLANEDLVRRFTVSVVNVAEGVNPDRHLAFLAPQREFQVRREGGDWVVDPRSYARFDTLAAVIASVDSAGAAELYYGLEPLMEEAYRDLGYPEAEFRETLRRALVELLEVPKVTATVELDPTVTSYEFADPALEGLTSAQKQLLRMGPANVERIQRKLREIGLALGFSAAELR